MPRVKTPTALKILRGTDQPCRRNDEEPKHEAAADLKPPGWLHGEGRKEWTRLAEQLTDAGVLKDPDLFMFAMYCKLVGHLIEDYGKGKKRRIVPPDYLSQLRYMSALFGLDPSSRSKIVATPKKKKNKFR